MTYEEGLKKALTVPWKVKVCHSGESCWCRAITPKEDIITENDEEVIIAHSGSIRKEYAEHIVKLHNDSLCQAYNLKKLKNE